MQDLIKELLSQKNFAVVGSFKNESKYAYRILKDLTLKGMKVYPVHPQLKEVEGIKCYPTVLDIPIVVDVVDIVTPPQVTKQIVEQCAQRGISRVWMQPGAESQEAIKFCQENKIKVVYNACVMLGR
ncbi:MAG: CoA-binding protein [bacterium]